MNESISLNYNWKFHLGEIQKPKLLAKKSYAFGGLTAPLENETGSIIPVGPGGNHFLNLISNGDPDKGLQNLAGTDFIKSLDKTWQEINIPDDWKRREPYQNDPNTLMTGSKLDGIAYYRKTFKLATDSSEDREYLLHFDGIMGSSDIWFNGCYLGHNDSGYVEIDYDVSQIIRFASDGNNVILVRTDTTTGSEGWWYEGAGIYKNVWIEVRDLVHLESDEFYFRTTKINDQNAKMLISFVVKNDLNHPISVTPKLTINQTTQIDFATVTIQSQSVRRFNKAFEIKGPKLWSPEHPHLYQARLEIENDSLKQTFGIKTVSYDVNGFHLNGKLYLLKGVCEHQDFGGVGIALNQDIIDFKVKRLKEMGVNALRSSHHFASKELLNACDRLGIILIDENRLLEATPWRLRNLTRMVKQSRSHVCISFWSIANEEIIGNTEYGCRSVKKITEIIRYLSPDTLLISAELLNPEGKVNDDYIKYFDILGVNYPEAGVMGEGAELIHQSHPNLPMMCTENASYFSTRGIYKDDAENCHTNNFGSLYSMVLPGKRKPGDPGVGGTARPETVMSYLHKHEYMGGVFLWTAFDYYGEPSPFGWPGISSQFGIMDLGGLPKDYFYYYQAQWQDQPILHLMPSWNKTDLTIENGQTEVRVFSNLDEVELFINHKSLGKKAVKNYECNWQIKYEPGELLAKGYVKDKLVQKDKKETSDKISKVNTAILYRGKNCTLFELKAIDGQNHFVPDDNSSLQIKANNGQIIGLTNGNPSDNSEYSLSKIKLFSGKAVVIVKHDENVLPKLNVDFD
ncbi:glycoside hydrolase family 2 protein [Lactobacillus melliventris]|uniref:DUF4982 domain-containing protein n=1 Tax=Lactobacillus melliventris TaxID=1218507 RepID=UPI0015809452|nr:DUF4982 domain-containing protein [Lactobacillus melliventris]NUE97236.1 glycoside hydrolase family 2 protein [Lactobacillus melliventris]